MNLKEIRKDIAELEIGPVTPKTVETLRSYYALEQEMMQRENAQPAQYIPVTAYSSANAPIMQAPVTAQISTPKSDFLIAIDGKSANAVLSVMDNLMDTLKATYPRAYNRVLREIREL